jgi:hypothetical protein
MRSSSIVSGAALVVSWALLSLACGGQSDVGSGSGSGGASAAGGASSSGGPSGGSGGGAPSFLSRTPRTVASGDAVDLVGLLANDTSAVVFETKLGPDHNGATYRMRLFDQVLAAHDAWPLAGTELWSRTTEPSNPPSVEQYAVWGMNADHVAVDHFRLEDTNAKRIEWTPIGAAAPGQTDVVCADVVVSPERLLLQRPQPDAQDGWLSVAYFPGKTVLGPKKPLLLPPDCLGYKAAWFAGDRDRVVASVACSSTSSLLVWTNEGGDPVRTDLDAAHSAANIVALTSKGIVFLTDGGLGVLPNGGGAPVFKPASCPGCALGPGRVDFSFAHDDDAAFGVVTHAGDADVTPSSMSVGRLDFDTGVVTELTDPIPVHDGATTHGVVSAVLVGGAVIYLKATSKVDTEGYSYEVLAVAAR